MACLEDAIEIINCTHLERGHHDAPDAGMCAMELVSFIADEPFSDHPECVCPVLGTFIRTWNDALPDDERDAFLKPILPRLIETRGSASLAQRRALMAGDWLVRTHTPAWLRLANLNASAAALEALPEITSLAQVPFVRGPIDAARRDAAAAGDAFRAEAKAVAWTDAWADAWTEAGAAAGAAGGDAARAAAVVASWDQSWDAAGDASWATGRDAAWAAAGAEAKSTAWARTWATAWTTSGAEAWAAARDAAWAAAGDALKDTQLTLQRSAGDLVARMIDTREAA